MKTISIAALLLVLILTPVAEAKTCYGFSCNYIDAATNNHFSNDCTDWTSCSSVTFPTSTTCSNGGKVGQIGNYASLTRTFTVDDTYTNGYQVGTTPFKLVFKMQLPGDTNNFYDELTVKVRDNTTSAEETVVYHGNGTGVDACSGTITLWLSNDYSNHSVTVSFTGGSLISHPYQIDDVNFFAYY